MRLSKTLLALMLSAYCMPSWSGTYTTTTTVNFTVVDSCVLSAPASVNLGTLRPGANKDHTAFDITISCSDATLSTQIYASSVGLAAGATSVPLKTASGSSSGDLWLTLSGSSTRLVLDGTGVTDTAKRFCSGTSGATRVCTLVPHTSISANGALGPVTATVSFNVVHI